VSSAFDRNRTDNNRARGGDKLEIQRTARKTKWGRQNKLVSIAVGHVMNNFQTVLSTYKNARLVERKNWVME